jgi:hypothetical protein
MSRRLNFSLIKETFLRVDGNLSSPRVVIHMACSKPVSVWSFAEIVKNRDASVRVTDDGLLYTMDLVATINGTSKNSASVIIARILEHEFDSSKIIERQLSKRGGHKTKLISPADAMEFIMILPGKKAMQVRKQFKEIIVRYLDGDRSMCTEIETNQALGKIESYSRFARKIMNQLDDNEAKKAHEMPQTFYVYATKSSAFPGLIKIGRTEDVAKRLSQLNTSCAPAPHVIVAVAPSFDKNRDEKTAHAFFSNARREGEFFELSEVDVIAYFTTHITAQYNTELAQNIARLQGLSVF